MDQKKIGALLKQLRREKGITQEQLAEILGVSGRTVSRWETGTNLPDLSILIQISEYYDVEIREILNGERRNGNMEKELKETLLKVADYHAMEKKKAISSGNFAFGITFMTCAFAIAFQILKTGDLSAVAGETAVLVIGGISYLIMLVKNGAWNGASNIKNTPKNNFIISLICSGFFSIMLYFILRYKIDMIRRTGLCIIFFIVMTAAGYLVLRLISFLSVKGEE